MIAVLSNTLSDGPTRSVEKAPSVEGLPRGILENGGSLDPVDEYAPLISKYGKPEWKDSTEYDNPRPVIPTRFIEYRPEHLKIGFVPIGKIGEAPPYKGWKVIAYLA